jgi:hypothetical protein
MITPELLGALGARTKQTNYSGMAGVSISGSATIDGCVGGPICAGSSGGIYGARLGADAVTAPTAPIATATANSSVVTGVLLAGFALGIFGLVKMYSNR